MKTYSADLLALLAQNTPLYKAELFMIGPLLNGQMIYATNGKGHIIFNGNTYEPVQYGSWSRDTVSVKIGLESNSTKLTVLADNQVTVSFPGTTAFLMDGIKYGLLGAANVTIYTAYMPVYGQVIGPTNGSLVETKFVGQITNVEQVGLTKAVIQVNDGLYLLNVQVPQAICQASCRWVLYSTGCTLLRSAFSRTNSVGSISNPYTFTPTSTLTPISASGTFTQGFLTWTTGPNAGLTAYVRNFAGGSVQLDVQPVFAMSVGDAFTISEGCNKTFASCLNLQGSTNSLLNFGGQPDTPVPETAV